jgi:hypothetical protein
MKLAHALIVLALVATTSGLYLGHRDPPGGTPKPQSSTEARGEQLSTEVVRLRRELAAMKAQIALLQTKRSDSAEPAAEPQATASESWDE